MKTAKKLLVLLLTIVLLNVTVISSFASVTPAVTDANKGKIVTVAFTYDNIAGIRGTFSMSGDDIVEKVELETSSDFSGNYNSKKGIIAYYSQVPSKFVCTLKLTISNQAAVGDEVAIKFEYESTVDGKLPTVPSYSYDYATIKIVPDLEELNRQIGIAQGLNKDDYTAESWKVVADALEEAIKAKNATTQREVDTAAKALESAVAGLVKKPVATVDYTELNNQIETAQKLNKEEYTAESWKVVADALEEAIKAKNATTQREVDAAVKALKNAVAGLVKKPAATVDYTELNNQIETAQKLNKEEYTAESWKVVADALEEAIKAKNATTQREVDAAVKALKNAVAGLVKKSVTPADVNYSKLQEQIDRVENLDKKKYTEESWNRVQVALDKANKLMNTGSQAEVDAAVIELKAAIDALEFKSTGGIVNTGETFVILPILVLAGLALLLMVLTKKKRAE